MKMKARARHQHQRIQVAAALDELSNAAVAYGQHLGSCPAALAHSCQRCAQLATTLVETRRWALKVISCPLG